MLIICASDKCYISNLLENFNYEKVSSPNFCEIYKCKYREHEFIISELGYGKVCISSSLRYIYDNYRVGLVLCIGTAGSVVQNNNIFNSVIPSSTVQFDVDFSKVGYPTSIVPKLKKGIYSTNNDINECLKRISLLNNVNYNLDILSTSDMFVSNYNLADSIKKEFNASSVDTESGTVGQFCFMNNIPYSCIKIISNFANNNAAKQFRLYDDDASILCQRIVYKFIKEFYT